MSDLNEIAAISNTTASIYNSATSVLDNIMERIDRIKKRNLDTNGLLRAYYFEVINNLEILEVINFDSLANQKINSKKMKALIHKINNEIGAMILFEKKEGNDIDLFAILEKEGRLKSESEKTAYYENILQAISFTVIKSEVIKRMSEFEDDEIDLLKDIKIKERYSNLRKRYILIKDVLDNLKAIKSLAR